MADPVEVALRWARMSAHDRVHVLRDDPSLGPLIAQAIVDLYEDREVLAARVALEGEAPHG